MDKLPHSKLRSIPFGASMFFAFTFCFLCKKQASLIPAAKLQSIFAKNKLLKRFYFISIFLLFLPPSFIILPILSTHYITGFIWGVLFLLICKRLYKTKTEFAADRAFVVIFILFFTAQSLSIINAQNVLEFINLYKNVLLSAMFLIISLYFVKSKFDIKKIIFILFLTTAINIMSQTLIFIAPDIFLSLGKLFLNSNYLNIIDVNIQRNRIYTENYDEILIPIITYFYIKNAPKKFLIPFSVLISVFSFFSGFRTKIIMLILSILGSIVIIGKNTKKYYILPLSILLVFYFLYSNISISGEYNVLDRFAQIDASVKEITSGRLDRWKKAAEIGVSSPVFGVGLGNYYDYLDISMQKNFAVFKYQKDEYEIAARDPHNIFLKAFAETGFLGLFSFTILLLYFFKKDFSLIRKPKNELPKAFIVSFWVLVFYSTLNPSSTLLYNSLFWLLRVVIEKS